MAFHISGFLQQMVSGTKSSESASTESAAAENAGQTEQTAQVNTINAKYLASLLAGDPVVLRLPEKETVQEQMILSALRQVMETQPEWKKRIVILRYGHVKEVTDALSRLCQVRVIWGGDHSIQEIQKSVLEPGKTELAFADRRSAAVLRTDAILEKEDLTDIVRGFYNDTYLNDQNACSSPSLLYWLGSPEQTALAHEKFWKAVVY